MPSTTMEKSRGSSIWYRLKYLTGARFFTFQLPFWSRSIKGIGWLRLWMKIEHQLKALVPQVALLDYMDVEFFFYLQLLELKSVKNELSELLKNVLLLHTQIQKVRASSGPLEILLANVESVTKALALAEEKRWSEAQLALKSCEASVEYLLELLWKDKYLERMRSELDLLPTGEDDPWEQFEEDSQPVYAVVVSAVALLSLVYHYLAGYIDRGGTKTYSSGSLEFRSTYVSIVLFQGAYVWIKFRDVAKQEGYRRPVKDRLSGVITRLGKPEARYKPPRESGNDNYIYLGVCATDEEAKVKKRIAAFYYGRNIGRLDFDDGRDFLIPSMPEELEQGLSVEEKRKWVRNAVPEVYEHIKASVDTNTVRLVGQIHAPRRSSLPVSDVAVHPEVIVEPLSGGDVDFCKFLEDTILDSSEAVTDLLDAEPQHHFLDNQVQDWVMAMLVFDNQCDNSEPLGTRGLESILNHVHGSSEVAAGGLTNEDAPYNPQALSEFPTMSLDGLQQHSEAEAVMSARVTPSASNLCPGNSTSDLLALKVISLLEQSVKEKDKRIVELERENERQNKEKDKRIVELEHEIESLRGASQY